jgi:hypothetical protein
MSTWVQHTNTLIVFHVLEVPRLLCLMTGWGAGNCREDPSFAVDAKVRPVGCGCVHYMDYRLANEVLHRSAIVFRSCLLDGLDGLPISITIPQGIDHSFLRSLAQPQG